MSRDSPSATWKGAYGMPSAGSGLGLGLTASF